jgi:hypothetical protein
LKLKISLALNVLLLIVVALFFILLRSGTGEVQYMKEHYETKYEVMSSYILNMNKGLSIEAFISKHSLDSQPEEVTDHIIVDHVYFFFKDDQLVGVE